MSRSYLALALMLLPPTLWSAAPPATLGPEQRQRLLVCRRMQQEALALSKAGDGEGAVGRLRDALRIEREVLGDEHPSVGITLAALTRIAARAEDHSAAARAWVELAVHRAYRLGDNHWQVRDARREGEQARFLAAALPGQRARLREAQARTRRMVELEAAGRLGEATREARAALAACEELLSTRHPLTLRVRRNLALLLRKAGLAGEAVELARDTARDTREILGADHPAHAEALEALGLIRADLGQVEGARAALEEALLIQRAALGEGAAELATSLNNLAGVCARQGAATRAVALYGEAREIILRLRGPRSPEFAAVLGNLAGVWLQRGDGRRALSLYRQSETAARAAVGARHPYHASCLLALARCQRRLGEVAEATRSLEAAADCLKATRGDFDPDHLGALRELSRLWLERGDRDRAGALLEQVAAAARGAERDEAQAALARFREGADEAGPVTPDEPASARALVDAGRAALAAGGALEAARLFEDALGELASRAEIARGGAGPDEAAQARALEVVGLYLTAASHARLPVARIYSRVLAAQGAQDRALEFGRLARREPGPAADLAALRDVRAGMALVLATPPGAEPLLDRVARYEAFRVRRDGLARKFERSAPAHRARPEPGRADAEAVADALPERTALVDFVRYAHATPPDRPGANWSSEDRLLAFVLLRGEAPVGIDLGAATPLDRLGERWRQALAVPGADDGGAGAELRRRLWLPLARHLGSAPTVLLGPEPSLAGLPLGALPGDEPGTYLLEQRAFAWLTSARDAVGGPARGVGNGLLALGGLKFGPGGHGPAGLPALEEVPGAAGEGEAILAAYRRAFPRAEVARLLEDSDRATLERALQPGRGPGPRWVSLAAPVWGVGGGKVPARAGLGLAGANRDADGGALTRPDLRRLDLAGVEVLTLSGGQAGEGGLPAVREALHEAGARTVVAGLWRPAEPAGRVLLEEFHAALWGERVRTRLEALRQAQLYVLRNPDRVPVRSRAGVTRDGRSPPAWWAGFVLSGAWR